MYCLQTAAFKQSYARALNFIVVNYCDVINVHSISSLNRSIVSVIKLSTKFVYIFKKLINRYSLPFVLLGVATSENAFDKSL
jgi:hypothetical protein